MHRRTLTRLLALGAIASGICWRADALAQDYPSKPVTIVVPYPAGSIVDLVGRTLGNELAQVLRQPFVVENRPGAYQIVAQNHVARQPADGYTLMVSAAPNVIPLQLQKTLANKGNLDFEVVAYAGNVTGVLAVNSSVPADNLQQFIALLKANPGKYMYGSAGPGTPHHLGLEQFNAQGGTTSVHVPYKNLQNIVTDVAAGQLHYSFLPFSVVQFAKDGRIKILGTTGLRREPTYPQIRTLDEQGLKGFEVPIKYFVVAPKGTPADVVSKLNAAINAAQATEAYAAKYRGLGGFEVPKAATPAQATQALAHEDERYNKFVRENKIQFD